MIPALAWLEQVADVAKDAPERIEGAGFGFAQMHFDLGERLLNRVHIGTVSR